MFVLSSSMKREKMVDMQNWIYAFFWLLPKQPLSRDEGKADRDTMARDKVSRVEDSA